MNYEELLIEADTNNLITKEKPLLANAGRIKGNRIAIKKDLPTQREKACVLAEELGHFFTSSGNILDTSDISNRKQEARARLWAFNRQVGLRRFKSYNIIVYLYTYAIFRTITINCILQELFCYI